MAAVAAAIGTSPRTVRKWRDRFAAEGEAGLRDRSSRPHRSPSRLSAAAEAEIEALRRQRLSGPAIARQLGRPVSSVGVALRRLGLGRLAALDPPRQVISRWPDLASSGVPRPHTLRTGGGRQVPLRTENAGACAGQ